MTPQEFRQRLESGETIKYSIWTFSATQMSCEECFEDIECCSDGFSSVDEAIGAIIDKCGDNLTLLDQYNCKVMQS
jgi:hypothetical protein